VDCRYNPTYLLAGFTDRFRCYGAFAALPIFLIWLYLVWVIVLAGAVLGRTAAMGAKDLSS
tara:strand:- start:91 stop:273 length:183 start_codon:yes stop_codon:yes gene_type:complete